MMRVALNFAIMLEQVKAKGFKEEAVSKALETEDFAFFQNCGNGLPDWQTLFSYYKDNKASVKAIMQDDYEITFLTKGTLKRLILLKYQLVEGETMRTAANQLELLHCRRNPFSNLQRY